MEYKVYGQTTIKSSTLTLVDVDNIGGGSFIRNPGIEMDIIYIKTSRILELQKFGTFLINTNRATKNWSCFLKSEKYSVLYLMLENLLKSYQLE